MERAVTGGNSIDQCSIPDGAEGYEHVSDAWIEQSESFDVPALYAPVLDLLPREPARVLDIGAGTGRDAAWFAGRGHKVTAVEPARRLREAGRQIHQGREIEWIEAHLPDLPGLRARASFDLIVLIGVWQHLKETMRSAAMARIFDLTAPKGRVILSLRHGPGAPDRPVFPIDPNGTIAAAEQCGFTVLRAARASSLQAANRKKGVEWTWMVLEAKPGRLR
ncbi:class I SAM-dependent methyltransferase [Roseibium denhamense]|uniref:class I SAM-dependent methyltransferase n=1 Tax=Roseibium denhamense TaxID=76305 RepID=UPI0018AD1695|nr:methyltransferase domain-containing protein [Roseibium denhamense]